VLIFAGTHGHLDRHPSDRLRAYEEQLFDFLEKKHGDITKTVVQSGKIDDALKPKLEAALKEFDTLFSS